MIGVPQYDDLVSEISESAWRSELEKTSFKYHMRVLWVATIFNPLFSVVDYYIIPGNWKLLLLIRALISLVTVIMFVLRNHYGFPSRVNIAITFLLISLQNAFIFSLIESKSLLGQNLNYIALLIGAAMFVLWEWRYSVFIVIISAIMSGAFISMNPAFTISKFFVEGGLLLSAVAVFMIVLINTRFQLFTKEIKTRLALEMSYEAIQLQGKEIQRINENLEMLVSLRTVELEKKNRALEEYAFINAHKLRAPVSNILGLIQLLQSMEVKEDDRIVIDYLKVASVNLDDIVRSISAAILKGD